MRRNILLVSIFFLAILLLSACKAQVATNVKRDGSGELETSIGFTADEIKTLQGMGTPGDLCSSVSQQGPLPPGETFKQEQRGDETWCVATLPFADLSALQSAYEDMQSVTVNRLDITNGKFVYDVTVDTTGSDQIGTSINISWQLDMPGKVGSNNADSVSGSTLIWNLKSGGSQTLHAESDLNATLFPSGSNWLYIAGGVLLFCLCLVVLIVIVVVVVVLMRRKKE